jgi:hypothetical protein
VGTELVWLGCIGGKKEFNDDFADEIIITVDRFEDLIQIYKCKL